MSLADLCRSRVVLQRQTVGKDNSGGAVRTWANVGPPVACDIQPVSAAIALQYMEKQLKVSHTIYFAKDVQALADCRFQLANGTRTFKLTGYRRAAPGYSEWPMLADVEEQPT